MGCLHDAYPRLYFNRVFNASSFGFLDQSVLGRRVVMNKVDIGPTV